MAGFRVPKPAEPSQSMAEQCLGLPGLRLEADRFASAGLRIRKTAGHQENGAKIAECFRKPAAQSEGVAIRRLRIGQAAQAAKRIAALAVIFGHVWLQPEGVVDMRQRRIRATGLQCDHSEKMKAGRVARIDGQRLAVQQFRLLQLAGLMMPHPPLKGFSGLLRRRGHVVAYRAPAGRVAEELDRTGDG